jgi:mannose-6-phosphate isomerase-like protein (cupin superfamily)
MHSEQSFDTGFVLHLDEGEVLPTGSIIKVTPGKYSEKFGVATQRFVENQGILIHQHQWDEEMFWVHKGRGTFILADRRLSVRPGSLVYIPPGTWHGFENEGEETLLVWVISPPHFVDLFRQLESGGDLQAEQLEQLFREHGFVVR